MPVMTKPYGAATAVAHVDADQVDVWKADGWKVKTKPKRKVADERRADSK